jgi:hypothetical protein
LPNSADASKNVFKEENVAAENVRTATTLKSRPVIINNIPVQKSPSINEDKPNVYAKFAEHDPMAPSPAPPVVDSPEPVLRKLSGEPLNLLQDAVDASQTAVEQKNKSRLFDCLSTSLRDRPPMLPRFPSDSIIYESTPVPSREPSLREIDSQGSLIEYIKQRKVELEEELGRMRALKATQIQVCIYFVNTSMLNTHMQAKKVKRLPKTYWVGQLKPRVDVRGIIPLYFADVW